MKKTQKESESIEDTDLKAVSKELSSACTALKQKISDIYPPRVLNALVLQKWALIHYDNDRKNHINPTMRVVTHYRPTYLMPADAHLAQFSGPLAEFIAMLAERFQSAHQKSGGAAAADVLSLEDLFKLPIEV